MDEKTIFDAVGFYQWPSILVGIRLVDDVAELLLDSFFSVLDLLLIPSFHRVGRGLLLLKRKC